METRKRIKKSVITLVCVLLLASMVLTLVACDDKEDETLPTISIVTDPDGGAELSSGDEVTFLVSVSDNSAYTVYVDNEKLAKINGKKMQILKNPTVDTEIKLIVKVNRFPNYTKSVSFVVKAPATTPTLVISSKTPSGKKLKEGDTVVINATVSDGSEAIIDVSNTELASVSGNTVSIISTPEYTMPLTITAKLKDYPNVTAERKYYVSAVEKEGEIKGANGNTFTTALLKGLGGDNITVNGTITDVYIDGSDSSNNENNVYHSVVKMDTDKWYGEWYADGKEYNKIYDNYRKGTDATYTYTDNESNVNEGGHALERIYINKNNEVATKVESDSMSNPLIWENQHLWNHLSDMATDFNNKFVYDADNDVFTYEWYTVENNIVKVKDDSDYYLLTYLSYSLTPLLEDTLDEVSFKMENGAITKMIAKTETQTGDNGNVAYTTVELTFSDIGTTEITDPEVYRDTEDNQDLANAIAKMKEATNYTFDAKEIATVSPDYDSSDYDMSASTSASFPTTASKGTVGIVGRITSDAILLKETSEYQNYMDYQYKIEYDGYKQVTTDTYDYFTYDATQKKLVGKTQYAGTIADIIPQWNFSANVFKFDGDVRKVVDGKTVVYAVYVLRDSQIMGEIAKEFSMHSNAKNTVSSSAYQLTITVDTETGTVVSASYPYTYGSWFGYVETTYSDIGTTAFTDEFDGYQARVLPEWKDMSTDKYYYLHTSDLSKYACYNANAEGNDKYHKSGTCDHTADFAKIISDIYGLDATSDKFVSLATLRQIFGDGINAFYNYDDEKLADGTTDYTDYISLTTQAPNDYLDEKGNLQAGFADFEAKIKQVLTAAGFTYSDSGSDTTGGATGKSDRKMVFANSEITIKITNNHTRHFWIEIYNNEDYA